MNAELEGPSRLPFSSDDMILGPSGDGDTDMPLQRATATYTCKDERFRLEKRTYDNQYAQLYFCRLLAMVPKLRARVEQAWPGVPVTKILDLPEGQEVAVIGTLYKEMKLKPSILDEYNKDRGVGALVGAAGFVSDDDSLVLEDESARMALRGPGVAPGPLVTGIVAAVRGTSAPNGEFLIKETLFVGLGPQRALPEGTPGVGGGDKYVALVSGLCAGDEAGEPQHVALLVDWLAGLLGSAPEQAQVAQIVRMVIAGGLLRSLEPLLQATAQAKQRQQASALAPIREMDLCLSQLAGAMPVDVMAGASDPANAALPQQPLHPCLLPGAVGFPYFHRVTNPHEFEVDGISFLGTSGQNIDDLDRYSTQEDRLQMLESVLNWGHLVPTAPDTLTAYAFADKDPFILGDAPHVLFAGNQPGFATRLVQGPQGQKVRLICIPKFSSSGMVLLVNLTTLNVQPITFEARMDI